VVYDPGGPHRRVLISAALPARAERTMDYFVMACEATSKILLYQYGRPSKVMSAPVRWAQGRSWAAVGCY